MVLQLYWWIVASFWRWCVGINDIRTKFAPRSPLVTTNKAWKRYTRCQKSQEKKKACTRKTKRQIISNWNRGCIGGLGLNKDKIVPLKKKIPCKETDKGGTEVVEAEAVGTQGAPVRLNWALVSLCQASSVRQKQYYRVLGLAKKKNNSPSVPEPLEHPNSWEIGGLSVAPLNGM